MVATKVEPRSLISWEVAIAWGGGRDDLMKESNVVEAIMRAVDGPLEGPTMTMTMGLQTEVIEQIAQART